MAASVVLTASCGVTDSVIVEINGEPDTLVVNIVPDSISLFVDGIQVNVQQLNLEVGDSARLAATAQSAIGNPVPGTTISWSSSNPDVAPITGNGLVLAIDTGSAVITASTEGLVAQMPVRVTAESGGGGLGTLTITPGSTRLESPGDQVTLQVVARDATGGTISSPSLTFTSLDPSLATVNANGVVTAVASSGSVTIRVTAPCCSASTARISLGEATLAFAADWGTDTGRSFEALTDGGRLYDRLAAVSSDLLEVVSLDALKGSGDLPDAWPQNGLSVSYAPQGAALVGAQGQWLAPAPGQSIYYRFLMYNAIPGGASISTDHGQQSNVGAIQHTWVVTSGNTGSPTFGLGFAAWDSGRSWTNYAQVSKEAPLRVEWAFHRSADGVSARVDVRIYDEEVSVTEPSWTDADMPAFINSAGNGTLEEDDPVLDMGNELEGFRSYLFGTSGSGGASTTGLIITGFGVSLDDWVGPYVAGEAN